MPKLRRVSLYTLETVLKLLKQIDTNPNKPRTFIEEAIGSIDHDSFDSHIVYLLNMGLVYFPEGRGLRISQRGQKCLHMLEEAKRLLDQEPSAEELQKLGRSLHHRYATKKEMDWMIWLDNQDKPQSVPDSRPNPSIGTRSENESH